MASPLPRANAWRRSYPGRATHVVAPTSTTMWSVVHHSATLGNDRSTRGRDGAAGSQPCTAQCTSRPFATVTPRVRSHSNGHRNTSPKASAESGSGAGAEFSPMTNSASG